MVVLYTRGLGFSGHNYHPKAGFTIPGTLVVLVRFNPKQPSCKKGAPPRYEIQFGSQEIAVMVGK